MNRILTMTLLAMFVLSSCSKDSYERTSDPTSEIGTLSFMGFALTISEEIDKVSTRASEAAEHNYIINIYDSEETLCYNSTYGEVIDGGGSIQLPAGNYTFKAASGTIVPDAAFESPVYGVSKEFVIVAGETTMLGELTCRLLQCKVSVAYNDDFLADVTGNCTTTVELTSGKPLVYEMTYDESTAKKTYEKRNGFFAINDGSTLEVAFKGIIGGKSQRMTRVFDNVAAAQWRQIIFVKKIDENGNAAFDIEIADYVEDEELGENIDSNEDIIGADPNAPQGDGGITLESTCTFDITQDIKVPAMTESFILTMKASVPAGVRKFTVEIESTNEDFPTAVALVNDGQTTLDLVNPSSGAIEVFETIVPFPYGNEVDGQTEILFDLSPAQKPIRGFSGSHTFIMKVTDNEGHNKEIPVTLVVE